MKKDENTALQQENELLRRQCAYLQRKLTRMREQQTRQENIDEINRHILKFTNQKLLQYHKKAQQESNSKTDFLANMSHEIRTPLNIILGMANLLANTALDKTQSQYLHSLRVTGLQLTEVLNNVIEFSRIDAGKITFEPEPFSLEKIINQLEASIMPLCVQKKLQYRVEHAPHLVMERIGEPLKIYQILLNLINNAVKFTVSGGISLVIKEDLEHPGTLLLSVHDTGIGISEEHQQFIFDRFTQVHDLFSRPHSGAGLGLAISLKLTEAMGGSLRVRSQPGQGSVFTCALPLPIAAAAERDLVRLNALKILPDDFPGTALLVVDDIRDNIEIIKAYLKDYPIRITAAGNGEEALGCLLENTFDVILMDIRMPVMDGISATREIRRREGQGLLKKQTILAITAHAFQEQKKKILEAGFDGILSKPFFKKDLLHTLIRFAGADGAPLTTQSGNKAVGFCLENDRHDDIPPALKEMLPILIQTITDDLSSMKDALEKKEYHHLYTKAHSLQGVAGMFGFQTLGSLIYDLSQSVKAGNFLIAGELFNSLESYLARIKNIETGTAN